MLVIYRETMHMFYTKYCHPFCFCIVAEKQLVIFGEVNLSKVYFEKRT